MRSRAGDAIEAILSRARQKIEPSSEGADIDATIGAARAKLGNLDTAGARAVLAAKIAEEETTRRQDLFLSSKNKLPSSSSPTTMRRPRPR